MIRVMIVDDQRPARMGFALMVGKDRGLLVIAQAGNGQEALDVLTGLAGRGGSLPDVVLMDVRMPVMDGIDATAAIKRLYPSIRVLILTTYDQDDYAFAALGVGASGFLLKDVHTTDLHRGIRAVYAGDAILTPRITAEVIRRNVPQSLSSGNGSESDDEAATVRERFFALGPREFEVASLISEGLTNAEIADRLTIQPDSAKKAVSRVLTKLGVHERVNVAVLWYKAGLDER